MFLALNTIETLSESWRVGSARLLRLWRGRIVKYSPSKIIYRRLLAGRILTTPRIVSYQESYCTGEACGRPY